MLVFAKTRRDARFYQNKHGSDHRGMWNDHRAPMIGVCDDHRVVWDHHRGMWDHHRGMWDHQSGLCICVFVYLYVCLYILNILP